MPHDGNVSQFLAARLKFVGGADDGNSVGSTRCYAFLGTITLVHAALATLPDSASRHASRRGQTKLSPSAQSLRELIVAGRGR